MVNNNTAKDGIPSLQFSMSQTPVKASKKGRLDATQNDSRGGKIWKEAMLRAKASRSFSFTAPA